VVSVSREAKSYLAFVGLILIALTVGWFVHDALGVDKEPTYMRCISTIGPVDAHGNGDTTPEQVGPVCP
jgi:hypothetical protein